MKQKIYKNSVFIMIAAFLVLGCDSDFEELNQNPNDPTAVPAELLLGSTLFNTANTVYNVFGSLDQGSGWAQHMAKVQYNDEMRYIPREGTITTVWDNFYRITASDSQKMYELGAEQDNVAIQGVARVLQAYGFLMLTDIFGDVPFSEALQAELGNTTPVFDTQEAVYTGSLAYLDEAITLLSAGGTIDASQDLLYGGNATNWIKFATSLKFRALMRISGISDVSSQIQQTVNSGNLFSSVDEEAKFSYLESDPNANPIFETIVFGTRGEYKINQTLVEYMDGTNGIEDGRLPIYADKNDAGIVRGKPSGFRDLPSPDFNYTNVSALGERFLSPTLPGYFVSYTEIQFLLAEAAKKGFISGGDSAAETYYLEGIRSSFAENGVSDSYEAYIAQSNVSYDTADALEQIAIQKWIALFSQGMETWIEWRRTDFPVLTPAAENDLGSIPVRFTYPRDEQSLNKVNYDAAVTAQGADALTTPVAWDN
ncbi:SusD/RagB family nutrient-binding outer membrane lipoprotein [Zobellia sp.]|nr:SusD/RagB family nutrient-binding outer membrane lipoprotein [Zobellia sp.]